MHIHPPLRFDSWGRAQNTGLTFSLHPELFPLRRDGQEGGKKISSGDGSILPYKKWRNRRIGYIAYFGWKKAVFRREIDAEGQRAISRRPPLPPQNGQGFHASGLEDSFTSISTISSSYPWVTWREGDPQEGHSRI
jgi:hypothetical protein